MGFVRDRSEIEYFSAKIENYLASTSHLFYPLTSDLGKHESFLFPGVFSFMLAMIGLLVPFKAKPILTKKRKSIIILDVGIVISFIFILATLIFGGINIKIIDIRIRNLNLLSPWIIFTIMVIIRRLLNREGQSFILSSIFKTDKIQILFLVLTIFAISISLGFGSLPNDKFYNFFYTYVPGFKFIRVPARIGMFVSFFLSLLSAYGICRLMRINIMKKIVFVIIPVILIEYVSFPIKLHPFEETPEVYRWMEKEKGDFSIIELPIDDPMLNIQFVYHSTKHWKKLVNGYSGFFPPSDFFVQEAYANNLPALLDYLDYIKAKYVILHRDHINDTQIEKFRGMNESLVLKNIFDNDDVYELKNLNKTGSEIDQLAIFKEIKADRWTAFSNYNTDLTRFAFDGDLKTRWHSGMPQKTDIAFTIDLKDAYRIKAISIELGKYYKDYPRELFLKSSKDGILWKDIPIQNNIFFGLLYSSIKSPKNVTYTIFFHQIQSRYIKLTLSRTHDINYWSIPEIKVYSEG
jgi:hypothetical protein